jgi:hypothetical protein
MNTTTRNFAAEYLAARKDVRRPGATLTEQGEAAAAARKILRAAERAGVEFNEVAIDEEARLALYPATPARPMIIGYTPVTNFPIYA